jgi:hypothetical protein
VISFHRITFSHPSGSPFLVDPSSSSKSSKSKAPHQLQRAILAIPAPAIDERKRGKLDAQARTLELEKIRSSAGTG